MNGKEKLNYYKKMIVELALHPYTRNGEAGTVITMKR